MSCHKLGTGFIRQRTAALVPLPPGVTAYLFREALYRTASLRATWQSCEFINGKWARTVNPGAQRGVEQLAHRSVCPHFTRSVLVFPGDGKDRVSLL